MILQNHLVLAVHDLDASAGFFRQLGFRAVNVLRDFYDDTTEDAYVMQYRHRPPEAAIVIPINRITKLAG